MPPNSFSAIRLNCWMRVFLKSCATPMIVPRRIHRVGRGRQRQPVGQPQVRHEARRAGARDRTVGADKRRVLHQRLRHVVAGEVRQPQPPRSTIDVRQRRREAEARRDVRVVGVDAGASRDTPFCPALRIFSVDMSMLDEVVRILGERREDVVAHAGVHASATAWRASRPARTGSAPSSGSADRTSVCDPRDGRGKPSRNDAMLLPPVPAPLSVSACRERHRADRPTRSGTAGTAAPTQAGAHLDAVRAVRLGQRSADLPASCWS